MKVLDTVENEQTSSTNFLSHNPNVEWLQTKGSWMIHVYLVVFGKILFSIIPGISPEASWTMANLFYNMVLHSCANFIGHLYRISLAGWVSLWGPTGKRTRTSIQHTLGANWPRAAVYTDKEVSYNCPDNYVSIEYALFKLWCNYIRS